MPQNNSSDSSDTNQEIPAMDAAITENRPQPWVGVRAPQPDAYPVKTMWKGTVLQPRIDGAEESFAIGPDGFVWSYVKSHDGQSAGRLISTGLQANVFAVGRGSDGRLLVVGADGLHLRFVTETGEPSGSRWSAPTAVAFPMNRNGMEIARIFTQMRGGKLFVGLLVSVVEADGTEHCCLWDGLWTEGLLALAPTPVDWAKGNAFWLARMAEEGIWRN